MTERHCLSRTWLLEDAGECPRIRRPMDGAVMELEGVDQEFLEGLFEALAQPKSAAQVEQLFEPLPELLPVFLEEGVLRAAPEQPVVSVTGSGPLRAPVDELVAAAPWKLPPLHVQDDGPFSGDAVALLLIDSSVVAMRLGCPSCFLLRTLGRAGEPSADQTDALTSPPALPPAELRALVAAALCELERTSLAPFQGLWVRSESGLALGRVLRHPDCARCGSARRDFGPAWLRRDLEDDGTSTSDERIRAVFGDSPFAPLELEEVSREPGDLPFDLPYVFGDTRLSRRGRGRVVNTSITGIVHGSAPQLERSRLLAWSEGVERLAAQSATFDLLLAPGDSRVLDSCLRYGWRPHELGTRETAWCRGLDLLRDEECLVPFGRVAVALPDAICPDEIAIESAFTGTASHVSSLEAILHASVELLKRDAFMLAWYRQRRLARVTLPGALPADIRERLDYLEHHGLRFELYDLRADLPMPMLLADVRATRRCGQWPAGGATLVPAGGFTPVDALRHLVTLVGSRFVGLGLDDSPENDPLDPVAVAKLAERSPFWPGLARYLDPARTGAFDFLRGERVLSLEALDAGVPDDPRQRFALLRAWLRAASLNLIAVPLTDDHVLEAGLRAVKVVVPEAIRLTLQHETVDRGQPRFSRDLPGAAPGSWNDAPHPVY